MGRNLGSATKFQLGHRSHCASMFAHTHRSPVFCLAVLALLVRYAHVAIPVVSNYTFETLLVAFLLLLAGNMFRGL